MGRRVLDETIVGAGEVDINADGMRLRVQTEIKSPIFNAEDKVIGARVRLAITNTHNGKGIQHLGKPFEDNLVLRDRTVTVSQPRTIAIDDDRTQLVIRISMETMDGKFVLLTSFATRSVRRVNIEPLSASQRSRYGMTGY